MSFNIEVQGGKNYLLPTAGKYCPQDIAIAAIGGTTDGMYCWAKFAEEPELPVGYTRLEYISGTGAQYIDTKYTINSTVIPKLRIEAKFATTDTTSNYRLNGMGGASPIVYLGRFSNGLYAWGNGGADCTYNLQGDTLPHAWSLDYKNKLVTVDNIISNVVNTNSTATYPNTFRISGWVNPQTNVMQYITAQDTYYFRFYENDALVREYLPCLDSQGIACMYETVEGRTYYSAGAEEFEAGPVVAEYAPDSYVLSDDLNAYPQDGYGEDGFYYKRLVDNIPWYEAGSYVWSKSDAGGNLISYVVSDDSSEFPEDGQGDDGYYYKLQEMGLSVKYANGTGTLSYQNSPTSSNAYATATFTVEGLGFRPQSVCWYCISNQSRDTSGYAISTGNGITTRQTSYSSVYANKAASFTDDGFSVDIVHNQVYNANNWPVYWWATGV